MSLLRLLTAAKSLENVKDDAGAYRVANRRYLPKFPSKQNPFRVTSRPEPAGERLKPSAVQTAETRVPEVRREPAPALKEARVAANGEANRAGGTSTKGWLGRWAERLGGWFRPRRAPSGVLARSKVARGAVQGELLLASVRVVRNDLSDSDLEVVPARPPAGKSRVREPARPAVAAGVEKASGCAVGAGAAREGG